MTETTPNFTIGPDGSRVRSLLKAIDVPGGMLDVIRLRPPSYNDVMAYGDPASLILMEGAALPHNEMSIVRQYVEALCTDSGGNKLDPAVLRQLDYRDALALKDAVVSFFK